MYVGGKLRPMKVVPSLRIEFMSMKATLVLYARGELMSIENRGKGFIIRR